MRDTSLSWQKKLGQGFSSVAELLKYLELPVQHGSRSAEQKFSTRIPLSFAQRMKKGNPQDPLLLQVLATEQELAVQDGYTLDPLVETNAHANPIKGLIHKYHGRVLLTFTGSCAVNCRYCFRRHFPYADNNPGRSGWQDVCDYIAKDTSITEVILSGGDPLLASNLVLAEFIKHLENIPHVHTLRVHTRIPVVFPERVDKELVALLEATRLKKVMVLHCNHPQELDEHVRKACNDLRDSGCTLLNQSVLLAGINDDPEILIALSQGLFAYGVLPYYLHVLDKVQGAAHFDLSFSRVQAIFRQVQNRLPGYLVPRLAREEPGKQSKTLLI